jgi:hypothetical protein
MVVALVRLRRRERQFELPLDLVVVRPVEPALDDPARFFHELGIEFEWLAEHFNISRG